MHPKLFGNFISSNAESSRIWMICMLHTSKIIKRSQTVWGQGKTLFNKRALSLNKAKRLLSLKGHIVV